MTSRFPTALRRLGAMLVLPGLLALSACTDTPDSPSGRGNIRAINALADSGAVQFQIEAVVLDTPDYLSSSAYFSYDSLSYDFNFDYVSGLTDSTIRLATTAFTVVPDTDYTLVLTGTQQSARIITIDLPGYAATGDTTVLEAFVLNLSATAGDVDFYIGAPGFDQTAAAPVAGSVAQDDFVSLGNITAEEIQVVVTPAGTPGTELLRTEAATLNGDDRVFISFVDGAGEVTSTYAVLLTGEIGNVRLVDDGAPVRSQLVHAAQTEGAVDLYLEPEEGPLTTPVFANVAFGDITALVDVPVADDLALLDLTVTAAGNPGTLLEEVAAVFADGQPAVQVLAGSSADDTLLVASLLNSRRPLADSAQLAVYNTIRQQDEVDIYLLEEDETFDRDTSRTLINNAQLGSNLNQFRAPPGNYTFYIVRNDDDVILLGPLVLEIQTGDVRQFITTDSADPNVSSLIDIDLTSF
ncbi:MAG: DUF4397 domain-containing protein [Pseudomonadota bacterium]